MGINVINKKCLWGGKSSVLWSRIAFYGSADVSPQNGISGLKNDNLPPQKIILSTVFP